MGEPNAEGTAPTGGRELGAVRVVDCSAGIAAAYCSKMFADAGADVVLVEPAEGTPLRRWTCSGPTPPGTDGALFRYLRHGQRAVVADVVSSVEREDLFADADVVILDADPATGALPRPDARALHTAHPHLVVVAITPYGLEGPFAGRPASELTVQADSGALAIRGRADRPPVQAGGQITDWVTGAFAAAAALAAVRGGTTTGRGALVDVSWAEVANMTCTLFSDTFDAVAGRPDLTGAPPTRSFETPSVEPTLDGYVGFNTNTRQQFEDFLVLIDRADLLADPSWANLATRTARWDEWNAIVHEWTTARTTSDIVEQAALLRIPVSPVTDAPMLLQLDHPVQRGVFIADPHGEFRMPRRPWVIDGEPAPAARPAPALGEHTDASARLTVAAAQPRLDAADAPPLAGMRVVDLTGWWAGPSATALLAALGADVVHVESIKRPDGIRMAGGAFISRPQWWELSPFFLAANTNKRDLTLDLATKAGRDLLLALVADADVVIENFTPRVLESFDLGWDVIHAANPRAVMVRMPAFGLDGPWRDRPGFAQTMEQVTGLAWQTGHVDDQPRIQRGPCDPNGGMHAAFATLVALARRDRTGVGSLVEAPMFEAAVAIAAEPVLEYTAYGNVLGRNGNRSVRAVPQGVYACAGTEQWLAVSVLDDAQWPALAEVMGRPEWAEDLSLATIGARRERHDEIDAAIAAWAATRPVADALAALVDARVPAAAAIEPRRSHTNPQFVFRGYFEVVDHPVAGPMDTPTQPFRWSGVERWVKTPAPTLGQHNAEILTALGCSPADIDALAADRIIGTAPVF